MRFIVWQYILAIGLFVGCTHPYEPEIVNTWKVEVEMSFVDPEFWPENQQLRVGLFNEESNRFPIASVPVFKPVANVTSATLTNVAEGSYSAQLYLTENGIYKVRIADLGEMDVLDNLTETTEALQLLTYDRVQRQVFNNCVVCHGSSAGDIAANLNLIAGNSYGNMVGVSSYKQPNMALVYAGSAEFSYLMKVLLEEIDFNHAASSSATIDDRQLVSDWIDEGAQNN